MCHFILHLTQRACSTRALEQRVAVRKQKTVVLISKIISELQFPESHLRAFGAGRGNEMGQQR